MSGRKKKCCLEPLLLGHSPANHSFLAGSYTLHRSVPVHEDLTRPSHCYRDLPYNRL